VTWPSGLDHLVMAVPDLPAAVDWFAEHTGVRPAAGGRHPGWGTANYLVGLGGSAYLEIIGPDPDVIDLPAALPLHVGTVTEPTLVTWALRIFGMDDVVDRLRDSGYDPGEPAGMSRRTAEGYLLAWSLTPDTVLTTGGLVPFLIDWGTSPHPTKAPGLPQVELLEFTAHSPNPDEIKRQLAALDVESAVLAGPTPALSALIRTPRGEVRIGPSTLV
jgi:catechol 2,3-dioxygenase-like lactoylglutathione lyase family enzyme